MDIRVGELSNAAVLRLLKEHHDDMSKYSPAESIHALNLSGLENPAVTFWSLWDNRELAGIGALKELDKEHGEIKSMRTSTNYLRKGVACKILEHIIKQSTTRLYKRISLETGTADAFLPALKLYKQFGFRECKPFSEYKLDPYSIFMTKILV